MQACSHLETSAQHQTPQYRCQRQNRSDNDDFDDDNGFDDDDYDRKAPAGQVGQRWEEEELGNIDLKEGQSDHDHYDVKDHDYND